MHTDQDFRTASLDAVIKEIRAINRAVQRAPLSGALFSRDEIRTIAQHARALVRKLTSIHALTGFSITPKARAEIVRTLKSYDAKLLGILSSIDLRHERPTFKEIEARAKTIDVFKACKAPVRVEIYRKHDGGHRLIHKPGWQHRARQWIVCAAFTASGVGSEFATAVKGIGANRLTRSIKRSMISGIHHWITADIKNCFPSVKLGHLRGITPIDARLLRCVLFTTKSVPILLFEDDVRIYSNDFESEARQGLAQGSKLSPLIASALLGRVLRSIASPTYVMWTYMDDIIMGARTKAETESFAANLKTALSSLKAGPLILKYVRHHHAAKGVNIIGRHIKLGTWDGLLDVSVKPSERSLRKMYGKALNKFGEKLFPLAQDEGTNELDTYLRNAARGYGWKPKDSQIYDTKSFFAMFFNGAL